MDRLLRESRLSRSHQKSVIKPTRLIFTHPIIVCLSHPTTWNKTLETNNEEDDEYSAQAGLESSWGPVRLGCPAENRKGHLHYQLWDNERVLSIVSSASGTLLRWSTTEFHPEYIMCSLDLHLISSWQLSLDLLDRHDVRLTVLRSCQVPSRDLSTSLSSG